MDKEQLKTLTQEIAAQLGETEAVPLDQIQRALKHCGVELVQTTVQEALAVEAQGGLLLPNGSRRRTLGGAFFFLLKQKVSQEMWWRIHPFHDPTGPRLEPMAWAERAGAAEEALTQCGAATSAKLVVVGRPTEVKLREGFVVATIEDAKKKLPTLPRGLPKPASTTATFKVCVVDKQWRKLEASLKKPDDLLIAEGYPFANEKTGSVIVLATQATTKLQQMALREAQTPSGSPSPQRGDGKGQAKVTP